MTDIAGVSETMATTRLNEEEPEITDASLDEDCVIRWGFRLAELYRLALLFFKDKQGKAVHLTYRDKLKLVAYTKQAAHGECKTEAFPDVGFLDVVGSDRRHAWRALGDMPQPQAMAEFITTLDRLCPLLRPFVQAHRTERDDKLQREQEEAERKRLEEEERVRQEMEIDAAKRQQLQREHQREQEMQIRAALNQQTAVQFQQYAEAQYPKNRQQQEELIGQLQEQHFHQYMQQVYRQQLMHQQQQYIQLQSLNRHSTVPCYDNAGPSSTPTACSSGVNGSSSNSSINNNNNDGLASSRTRGAGSKAVSVCGNSATTANQFAHTNHINSNSNISNSCGVNSHDRNHNKAELAGGGGGGGGGGGAVSSSNNNSINDNHWAGGGGGGDGGSGINHNIMQSGACPTAAEAGSCGVGLTGMSAPTMGTVPPTAMTAAAEANVSSAAVADHTQQGPPLAYTYNEGLDDKANFNCNNMYVTKTNNSTAITTTTTTTTTAAAASSTSNAVHTEQQAERAVVLHANSLFGVPVSVSHDQGSNISAAAAVPGSVPALSLLSSSSSAAANSTLQPHQHQHQQQQQQPILLSQIPQPPHPGFSQENDGIYNNNNNSYSANNNNSSTATPPSRNPVVTEEVGGGGGGGGEEEAVVHGNPDTVDGYGDMGELPPLAAASLWTRGEMKEFKAGLSQEKDCVIRVGSGETVTVRVPTHQDGSCLFWEFATDSYDIGFGVYFEWTISHSNAVSIHVSDSSDPEDDDDEEDDLDDGDAKSPNSDPEKGHPSATNIASSSSTQSASTPTTGSGSGSNQHRPPTDEIIPVYRRDSHQEVYCGNHAYPGRGVYLLKFDNSYSLWRSKTLYYRVYYTG